MNINNAYKVYRYLFKKHHPGQVVMPLKECIHNLIHSLLQQGTPMRKRGYGVSPKATKDITIYLFFCGWESSQEGFIDPQVSTVYLLLFVLKKWTHEWTNRWMDRWMCCCCCLHWRNGKNSIKVYFIMKSSYISVYCCTATTNSIEWMLAQHNSQQHGVHTNHWQ